MSVKNIALLVIVIGLVLIIMQTNEPFEVVEMGSVSENNVCKHDTGDSKNGSTECLSGLHCVRSNGYLVNKNDAVGTCQRCTNSDVGQNYNSAVSSFAHATGAITKYSEGEECRRT